MHVRHGRPAEAAVDPRARGRPTRDRARRARGGRGVEQVHRIGAVPRDDAVEVGVVAPADRVVVHERAARRGHGLDREQPGGRGDRVAVQRARSRYVEVVAAQVRVDDRALVRLGREVVVVRALRPGVHARVVRPHVVFVARVDEARHRIARDAHGERAARRDRARVRRPLQRREVEGPAVLPEVAALPDRAAVEEHGAARAEPGQEREVVVGVARDQPAIGVRATVHATVAHRVARQVQARERGGVEVERVDLVAAPVVVPAARDQQAIADRVERTAAVGGDAGAARSAVQCRIRRVARAQRTQARVRQLVPARAVRQHAALRDRGSGEAGDQDRRSLQGTGSGRITGATVAKPRRPIRELAGESVYARRVGLDAECSFPAFGSP